MVEICRPKGNPYYTQRHHCCYDYIFSTATPYNRDKGSIYLVLDFCEHDLAGLLECKEVHFSLGEIKNIMQQLFNALSYIHGNNILHCDMKSCNILMTCTGELKLADFGLARALNKGQNQHYINRVVTLWYRPPELLLGEQIMALQLICGVLDVLWLRCGLDIRYYKEVLNKNKLLLYVNCVDQLYPRNGQELINLNIIKSWNCQLKRIGKYESISVICWRSLCTRSHWETSSFGSKKRIDADAALEHDFFWKDPLPTDLTRTLSALRSSIFVMHTGSHRPVVAP